MLIDDLSKEELKDLLVKNWMTHDGAWFLNSYLKYGIDAANKLNKGAIKTLAPFEINRVKKKVGLENKEIKNYDELKKFIDDAFSILKGDFMRFNYSFPGNNCIHWDMGTCFAYEGMKRLGIQEDYECGVVYRVSRWLKEIGLKHKIQPKVKGCLLNSQERCSGDIIVSF
jgi:hypothetical protein